MSAREFFSTKNENQIFSLCLLVFTVCAMLFFAIVRLCGCLWFSADLSAIGTPNAFCQEAIKAGLLIFELLFVYKILCRTTWRVCLAIATIETTIGIIIGYFVNNETVSNIYYMSCILLIPTAFVKTWFSLLENVILYLISMLYGIIFLVGRIGNVSDTNAYNFIYNMLGSIDFKLFFVALYLVVKNFGGIRLWKTQKRLIFQADLSTSI